jgi:hypothetical protein
VARRRYGSKSPATSTAGHQERPPDPAPDESFAQPLSPRAEYGEAAPDTPETAPEPAHYDVSGLKAQLEAQQQYAQQHAQQHALHQYIAAHFPGTLPNERQWLIANPHHLSNPALVHQAAGIALQRGIPRQSPEFLQAVGALLDQHAAAQMQPAPAVPPPLPPTMPAQTHIDVEKVEGPDHEPDDEPMPSHYMSAPVSRGDLGGGHTYEAEPSHRVTLTAEERELCRDNKLDEAVYAANKLKLQRMKKSKLIE